MPFGVTAMEERVYIIDPALFISHRKSVLDELISEALREGKMTVEDEEKMWKELNCEPWPDDPSLIDAAIDYVASRLGVIVKYEFR